MSELIKPIEIEGHKFELIPDGLRDTKNNSVYKYSTIRLFRHERITEQLYKNFCYYADDSYDILLSYLVIGCIIAFFNSDISFLAWIAQYIVAFSMLIFSQKKNSLFLVISTIFGVNIIGLGFSLYGTDYFLFSMLIAIIVSMFIVPKTFVNEEVVGVREVKPESYEFKYENNSITTRHYLGAFDEIFNYYTTLLSSEDAIKYIDTSIDIYNIFKNFITQLIVVNKTTKEQVLQILGKPHKEDSQSVQNSLIWTYYSKDINYFSKTNYVMPNQDEITNSLVITLHQVWNQPIIDFSERI